MLTIIRFNDVRCFPLVFLCVSAARKENFHFILFFSMTPPQKLLAASQVDDISLHQFSTQQLGKSTMGKHIGAHDIKEYYDVMEN